MDVTGPRLNEAFPPRSAAARERAAGSPADARARGEPPRSPAAAAAPWVPHSILKTGLTAADVHLNFEIDEDGSRVTVTMTDRVSGEVLRQIPPREMNPVVQALIGLGLIVDVER